MFLNVFFIQVNVETKQTDPPDFLTRGLGPDNGTVICLSDQIFLQFMFGALGYLFLLL